jgi:hypothetical protein
LWQHTLQVEFPEKRLVVEAAETRKIGNYAIQTLAIGRANRGDRVPVAMITPAKDRLRTVVVLAHPDGKAAYLDADGAVKGLAKEFLQNEQSVILLDLFLTGDSEAAAARKHTANYFTTYNRTDAQERVQDLITACAFAQTHAKGRKVVLCGEGRAGLYAMLAAPAADAVIADADALDYSSDSALMSQDLFIPGLRRMGGFAAALSLDASKRTFVHNAGKHLTLQSQRDRAKVEPGRANHSDLVRWAENFGKQNNLSRAN